ncbi:MAG: ferritin-like domain-containing protein [Acidothermus sp.]|nr:ferritin-like domain-containing protein [Acidothermus sp.]
MASSGEPVRDDLQAVADILGVLAYGELTAFERLAYDARMAPTLEDKAALGRLATAEFEHFEVLAARLVELGIPAQQAIEPFVEPLEEFHARTAPSDWAESLVKAYVGDGLMRDFYREVTRVLDPETRVVAEKALADTEHVTFLADRIRRIMAEDPRCAGRLALWARRIVGEALVQARLVSTRREALVRLLSGGRGVDLAAAFDRIIEAHGTRMAAVGLSA